MLSQRAQSAIEFMVLIGMIVVFFIVFMIAWQSQRADQVRADRDSIIKEIASIVQDEINLAHTAHDGYSRTFSLPQTVLGSPYNVTIEEMNVYVRTLDGRHALALPVKNVTGTTRLGANTIRTTNRSIYLNL